MKLMRVLSWLVVLMSIVVLLMVESIAPRGYSEQFREYVNAPPSKEFLLGTDELGRDRWARLLHGTRVSLLLAPAAATIATGLALLAGIIGAYGGRLMATGMSGITDVLASIPTLFLLLSARAALPLDMPPTLAVCITFLLLGLLGWTSASRVIWAAVLNFRSSTWLLQARASGCSGVRLFVHYVVPALTPVVAAAFWTSIPMFLIAEANLGLLGLGVTEPLPSLGTLLSELQNFHTLPSEPWRLAPAVTLVINITAVQILTGSAKESR